MEDYTLDHADSLIQDFTNELNCKKYRKADLKELKCFFLYLDKKRTLELVKSEVVTLQIANTILKRDIVDLVKKYNMTEEKKYSLIHMFKYNLHIDECDIKNMSNYCFLETIESLSDVSYHPTINVISDINSLYMVFIEKDGEVLQKKTKKNRATNMKKTNKNLVTK